MCFGRLMLSRIACARVTRGKGDNYSENKSIQLQIMSLRILNLSANIFGVWLQKQTRKKVHDATYEKFATRELYLVYKKFIF